MKSCLIGLVSVALAATIAAAAGGAAQDAERQLKAAMNTELVDGNLKAAIEQYRKVAESGNRALAAHALLRMAECYQKLGDAEAQKIYERLVRDFADQKDAVTIARAHLGPAESRATRGAMTSRRLWTTPQGLNWDFLTGATISPDGRFLSYTDWQTGNLGLHEFATGSQRRLTNNALSPQYESWAEESAISRDGKHVAYSWFNGKDRYELRVASLEGAGVPQSRLLFDNEDIEFVMPCDWSPDGNWIAVELHRADKTRQMGVISMRDGSLRVLKSAEWSGSIEVFFSPDGKYLGFDAPVGDTSKAPRDVFMMAVDGSRQTSAASGPGNDTMMGWSADGNHLLFASDRGGTISLWAVAVADGKSQGTARLVKSDISRFSLGVSASGSLYTGVAVGDREIHVASVDFETGKLVGGPVRPVQSFVGTNTDPAWSADGKRLAYKSNRPPPVYNTFLGILSGETGQAREFQPKLTYFQNIRWAADSRSFIVGGRDLKGRQGQYRIEAQTGEVTPIAARGQLSPDGKKVYPRKDLGANLFAFVEQDLASGQEREIIRRKNIRGPNLSPDGRFMAITDIDDAGKSSTVVLVPVGGGEPRELLRVNAPQSLGPAPLISWMPGGRGVLVIKFLNDGTNELWLVPIAGGQPRKIDVGASQFETRITVHPDGRQVAYVAGHRKAEVWVLENSLAALKASR